MARSVMNVIQIERVLGSKFLGSLPSMGKTKQHEGDYYWFSLQTSDTDTVGSPSQTLLGLQGCSGKVTEDLFTNMLPWEKGVELGTGIGK